MWSYWSRLWVLQELELASRDMYISKLFFLQLGTLSVPQGMLKEQLLRLLSLVRLTLLSCALLRSTAEPKDNFREQEQIVEDKGLAWSRVRARRCVLGQGSLSIHLFTAPETCFWAYAPLSFCSIFIAPASSVLA